MMREIAPAAQVAERTLIHRHRRLSIAPMLDWTDRHFRFLARLISRQTLLYTEMVTTGAIIHGDAQRFLRYHPDEHPIALQLGGSDPADMARCTRIAADWGYDEVNINVGCPSDRVQNGRFGACLMAEPALVAECVRAMRDAAEIPVTVKTRIGIDDRDSYAALVDFVGTVKAAGCDALVVHARKAWLKGLSPRENRDIPPLRYDVVLKLKQDFPDLNMSINGGITSLTQATAFLQALDGVMIGREAYHNPWMLAEADQVIFGVDKAPARTRRDVLASFLDYADAQLAADVPLTAMSRHLLGLFQGQPGARAWRRQISEQAHRPGAGLEVFSVDCLGF